ncbi:MAG: DUF2726 domain-containing protein [Lachnospiraceae bacterium]
MGERKIQLKKRVWDSNEELYTYNFLKSLINEEAYKLFPHIVLRDIFDNLEVPTRDYHIDFLITNKVGNPILGIEINGPHHQNNLAFKAKDAEKQFLFSEHSIPLVFIPICEIYDKRIDDIEESEYIRRLEKVILDFIAPFYYHISIPHYCPKCFNMMEFYYNNTSNKKQAYINDSHKSNKFYMCSNCKSDEDNDKPYCIDSQDVMLPFKSNE